MSGLVLRGIVIGLLAGLLGFGWARTLGEPAVAVAISYETAQDATRDAAARAAGRPIADDPDIFSRDVQSGIGLLTGLVAVGAGIGGLFAVLFALANGRLGWLAPGPTAILLALGCLVTFYVVPDLKYPANPPAIGQPDTIRLRTGLYFLLLAISLATTLVCIPAYRALAGRLGGWHGAVAVAAGYVLVLTAAMVLLPTVDEVPPGFPAATLWNFRLASLGLQTVLWMSVGLMFGLMADRQQRRHG